MMSSPFCLRGTMPSGSGSAVTSSVWSGCESVLAFVPSLSCAFTASGGHAPTHTELIDSPW